MLPRLVSNSRAQAIHPPVLPKGWDYRREPLHLAVSLRHRGSPLSSLMPCTMPIHSRYQWFLNKCRHRYANNGKGIGTSMAQSHLVRLPCPVKVWCQSVVCVSMVAHRMTLGSTWMNPFLNSYVISQWVNFACWPGRADLPRQGNCIRERV